MNPVGYNAPALLRSFMESLERSKMGRYRVHWQSRHGHTVLIPFRPGLPRLYVVCKRDFYKTFMYEFSDFCVQQGIEEEGDCINVDALERCLQFNCDVVVFVHEGWVRAQYPLLLKNYCIKFDLVKKQDRENFYRVNGGLVGVNELTYVFPVSVLSELIEVFDNG